MLDKLLFKAKDWQLFLLFVVIWFAGLRIRTDHVGLASNSFLFLISGIYVMILGLRLKAHKVGVLVSGFVFIVSLTCGMYIVFTSRDLIFVVMILIGMTSHYVMISIIAYTIRSVELQRSARFKDYFIDIMWLTSFAVVGVFMVQPRLNSIGKQLHN